MSELIERARRICSRTDFNMEHCKQRKDDKRFWCLHCLEADEIERLQARVEALEAALQNIADSELSSGGQCRMTARKALAALKEESDDG